jgi:outer membrane protein assembly factor BamA
LFFKIGLPLFFWGLAALAAPPSAAPDEAKVFSDEGLRPFEGRTITKIEIHGLIRTSERAVRWLLGNQEGEKFSTDAWILGLQKLYNTSDLYDLKTKIRSDSTAGIAIDLFLKDKWTLLPYATLQGGGGTYNYGGGVFDTNLGGYFTNVAVGFAYVNQDLTYDLNFFQEWISNTNFEAEIDISRNGAPTGVQDGSGNVLGNFTWDRNQQQFMFGRRFPNIRSMLFFEVFNDQVENSSTSPGATVYPEEQYRLRPLIIFGRVNLSNFLERGYELTLTASFANFFSGAHSYYGAIATFKNSNIVRDNDNFSYFVNVGALTDAPYPYRYHLGGYDTVRGFNTYRFIGSYYVSTNIEYRPLLAVDRFSFFDLDQIALQGCVFVDAGYIWSTPNSPQGGSSLGMLSAGVGLRINFVRFAGAIIRMDLARTVTPDEGFGFSFGVGQFF